ncbi:hypothetical protein MUB24_08895 [Lederbergia sp. NSJ-179]|uniref:TrmH family RNA methyltransferase n=1 Tax=Lederbergia sp. NSJ-179 TaxID=2931402 RepID=UPI001FCFC428|nr:TrmH family RNA methyltransferase [Lederbergia sp. NSJ-179]MCJ7841016.1 hypothetical protein [Lederbergia sp. NSJ-179]
MNQHMDLKSLLEKYKTKLQPIGGQHAKIKQIRSILNGKNADTEMLFAVEGIWAHQKLMETDIEIESLLFCPECIYSEEAFHLVKKSLKKAKNVYVVSKKVMERFSQGNKLDGLISIGLFPRYNIESLKLKKHPVVVILDGLEQAGNIGTILRTCDGAGVDGIFICNKKVKLTNPKLIKASMGGAFTVPIIEFADVTACINWLRKYHFHIYLADTRANRTYKQYEYEGNTALVIGSERYGISEEWYDCHTQQLFIPMHGLCDSLNVGTATAVIVYEITMKKAGSKK